MDKKTSMPKATNCGLPKQKAQVVKGGEKTQAAVNRSVGKK